MDNLDREFISPFGKYGCVSIPATLGINKFDVIFFYSGLNLLHILKVQFARESHGNKFDLAAFEHLINKAFLSATKVDLMPSFGKCIGQHCYGISAAGHVALVGQKQNFERRHGVKITIIGTEGIILCESKLKLSLRIVIV